MAGALLAGAFSVPAVAAAPYPPGTDSTSQQERRRVDSLPTPKLDWYSCFGGAQCATVKVPLDYDDPKGPKTELALARVKARDPKNKIGTLFVNPGGPGGSGVDIALAAPRFLSPAVLARFDVVGIDPRGVASSENLRCFKSHKDQTAVLADLNVAFPYTAAEEKKYVSAAQKLGKACSTTGKPLSGAVSTAEVVRDMELMRRAVGDKKLTFLGFSYGTAIGQYYANMFPERFRAIVADGVLDPEHWVGTKQTAGKEQDERLGSAVAADKALREILVRCDSAGKKFCVFAGDSVKRFDTITTQLKKKPLVVPGEEGEEPFTLTYADFIGAELSGLYSPEAGAEVTTVAQMVWEYMFPADPAAAAAARTKLRQRAADMRTKHARDFPYDNGLETFLGVDCTDALHPKSAASWPGLMDQAERRAPNFGRLWGWQTAPCARDTWTVRDEDAYTGPWTRRTAAPVLLVGNLWDPATAYTDAVSASKRLPNSRLLTSTNWGHTAYGTSDCATRAVDVYLVTGALPAENTRCEGPQPFTQPIEPTTLATKSAAADRRPPVAAPRPVSVLNGTR